MAVGLIGRKHFLQIGAELAIDLAAGKMRAI